VGPTEQLTPRGVRALLFVALLSMAIASAVDCGGGDDPDTQVPTAKTPTPRDTGPTAPADEDAETDTIMPAAAVPRSPLSPHAEGFLAEHGTSASEDMASCRECHTDEHCASCHEERIPTSHGLRWLDRHEDVLRVGDSSCASCHPQGYCAACHRGRLPASHLARRWSEAHGSTTGSDTGLCAACHELSTCDSCHGIAMPHPDGFAGAHREVGQSTDVCAKCHSDEAFCRGCHSQQRPASHDSAWLAAHGAGAGGDTATCSLCHRDTERYCDGCHGLPMPHAEGYRGPAHATDATSMGGICAGCHTATECDDCHGLTVPHVPGFPDAHGTQALELYDNCVQCHDENDECNACHGLELPHPEGFRTAHKEPVAESSGICSSCHGDMFCWSCHKIDMPHPEGFSEDVKVHGQHADASHSADSVCTGCHSREEYCEVCHPPE